ncbi:MAG: hypothetical protein GH150_04805 [Hadesarchaea archaeon]|nr:hypothetical protein [Hadesarchaea archaeon]
MDLLSRCPTAAEAPDVVAVESSTLCYFWVFLVLEWISVLAGGIVTQIYHIEVL